MNNLWLTQKRPFVIGHRGAKAYSPENTMGSLRLAMAQGAVGVEFDVRLSADNHVVIIHDDTVDRTSNGTGKVSEMSLADLRQLDFGNGQQISTLAELFADLGKNCLYNVELKQEEDEDLGLEKAVAEVIQVFDYAHLTTVSSFNPSCLLRMEKVLPENCLIGTLWYGEERWELRRDKWPIEGEADHPYYKQIDADYIKWAKANNKSIHTWTIDDPDLAVTQANMGVDAFITNDPRKIIDALKAG